MSLSSFWNKAWLRFLCPLSLSTSRKNNRREKTNLPVQQQIRHKWLHLSDVRLRSDEQRRLNSRGSSARDTSQRPWTLLSELGQTCNLLLGPVRAEKENNYLFFSGHPPVVDGVIFQTRRSPRRAGGMGGWRGWKGGGVGGWLMDAPPLVLGVWTVLDCLLWADRLSPAETLFIGWAGGVLIFTCVFKL